jgi:hypothetical protein
VSSSLDSLFADLLASQQQSASSLPPVHLWHPEFSGDIDIRVDREGRWFHEGGEIKRPALVKLFASILLCEEGSYFLVTPVEKWRIQVEVAPLFVVGATREQRDGKQAIVLTTRTENVVVVDAQHPLRVELMPDSGQPLPLVTVRDNLTALISRNVFYQLVEWAAEESDIIEGAELSLSSMGQRFSLGRV